MDRKKTIFLAMGIAGLLAFVLVFSCSFGEDDDDDDDDFSPEDDDDDIEPNPLVEGWNDICECAVDTIPAASVDSEDRPWIAFVSGDDQVKVAYHDQGQWLSSTITGITPSAQDPIAMVLDPGDNPHLLFRQNTMLYYATLEDKSWTLETITAESVEGYDISYSNNTPLVAYYGSGGKSFVYAARSGSSWESFDLETGTSNSGGGCSIEVDLADYPVIAFIWDGDIRVASWPGGTPIQETLAESSGDAHGGVGVKDPQVGFDNQGNLWCCYYYSWWDLVMHFHASIDCRWKSGSQWHESGGEPYADYKMSWPKYLPGWMVRNQDTQYIAYSGLGAIAYAYYKQGIGQWIQMDTGRVFWNEVNTLDIAAAQDGTVYMVLNDGGELTLMMKLPD